MAVNSDLFARMWKRRFGKVAGLVVVSTFASVLAAPLLPWILLLIGGPRTITR